MASLEYLADGHQVDDAGNLIACHVRRLPRPGGAASDYRIAEGLVEAARDPRLRDDRISKPTCFVGQGEGIIVLRNAVVGRTFSTAHKSQTVYHGPVAYLDDPYRRLESASSELEFALLLVS